MPVRPLPIRCRCTSCGWQRTTHPRSDALQPGIDFLKQCPQCQSTALETRPMSGYAARLLRLLNHLWP